MAMTSCTTGLHLILVALGIGPGDEVIVPAFTWVATANVVVYCGATPVFADVDRRSYNIDPSDVAAQSRRTRKPSLPSIFSAFAPIWIALRQVIPSRRPIVEDAACAAGARYKGVSAGALGEPRRFPFIRASRLPPAKAGWSRPMMRSSRDTAECAQPWRVHLRGTAAQGAPAVSTAGLQSAGLQLPHDRSSRRGRHGADWPSSIDLSPSGTLGHVVPGELADPLRGCACRCGRRGTARLAGLRYLCRSRVGAARRATKSWSVCSVAASARGRALTLSTCWAITASASGSPGDLPGGAGLRCPNHGHSAAQPDERRRLPLCRRCPQGHP